VSSVLVRLLGVVLISVGLGLGTNSSAMLIGMAHRGIVPDLILFADTGGEKPHTYTFLSILNEWLREVNFPQITVVRGDLPQQVIDETLEGEVLRLWNMPSKAYGFSTCSQKWKIAPQDKYIKKFLSAKGLPEDTVITKLIGFDADEAHRAAFSSPVEGQFRRDYPLIDWQWGRMECIQAIEKEGLPLPGKSSCFFCPSTKKYEIIQLMRQYPEYLERALEIERRGMSLEKGPEPKSTKGLGRSLNWGEFVERVRKAPTDAELQELLYPEETVTCDYCYDGV